MPLRIAYVLVLVAVCLPVVTGCSSSPTSAEVESAKKDVQARKNVPGPWPECPIVLDWFEKNLPDPKSLEIIEWEKRYGSVNIEVKYRAKNELGGMSVSHRVFLIRDGKVLHHYTFER